MPPSGFDDRPKPESRRAWWREPLLHFVVLGGLVFLVHRALFGPPTSDYVTPADAPVEQIREDWVSTHGALPSAEQETALIREWIEDEVLYRRAIELGLDRNDTIVRRRLVQRMRFLLEDTARIEPPTDAALRAWLDQHPKRFELPARVTFSHQFFSRGKRGSELFADARSALRLLREDPNAVIEGDPFFRGSRFEEVTASEIRRAFGPKLAEDIQGLPLAEWRGPFESSYGLHLVLVTERKAASVPAFESVRDRVEQDWLESERARHNDEAVARLRARYAPEEFK